MADALKKVRDWLEAKETAEAPERSKLAKRITKHADDEERAGLLNRALDEIGVPVD
jgi:hypothetical protein